MSRIVAPWVGFWRAEFAFLEGVVLGWVGEDGDLMIFAGDVGEE